jgi:colanic acid biosynthesis glycosyl transferase WcaI
LHPRDGSRRLRERSFNTMTMPDGERPAKRRLLVLNEYYWPGVEATAQLLSQLCEDLAEQFEITVITGALPNARKSGTTFHNGVHVIRVRSTAFERRRLALRGANYFTYAALALAAGVRRRRPDAVVCMTDPPFLGTFAHAVARRFGAPLVVISQDVFPEIAVELGRVRNPVAVRPLGALISFHLKRAERVVAIGRTMRERLEAKGVDPARIEVIPNWVDVQAISPRPKHNDWSKEHGLADVFVVMHSGNVGHAQDLDTLLAAASLLRDVPQLKVVIVGSGARHAELVRLAARLQLQNVVFLPYQPRDVLSESLSAADVHVVGLARGLSGLVVPSRMYGILAAGRPVIVSADPSSEPAQLVAEVGCGVTVLPGRPQKLAAAIRAAYEGRLDLESMGRRARAYAEVDASREVAVERYRALLDEVVARSGTTIGP